MFQYFFLLQLLNNIKELDVRYECGVCNQNHDMINGKLERAKLAKITFEPKRYNS